MQRRSGATCTAILEAAARILESEGGHRLTTNGIAAKAGVSVGSLYQYFPAKEAIVVELVRTMRADMVSDFETAARETEGLGLRRRIDALVSASIRHHLKRPALAQALEREEAGLPLDAEMSRMKTRLHAIVVEVLRHADVAEPERTAFDLIALSHGLADAAVQAGQRDFNDLAGRLRRAVLGYLGVAAEPAQPERSASGPT